MRAVLAVIALLLVLTPVVRGVRADRRATAELRRARTGGSS